MQLGGGVRDMRTVRGWLEAGVSRVIIGTAAVRDPDLVREAARLFPNRIAVGIDARDGRVAVEGWAKTSNISALDLGRRFEDAGVAAIIYTDIARDGALSGLNIAGTVALAEAAHDSGHRFRRARLDRGRAPPHGARLRPPRRRDRRPRALRRATRPARGAGSRARRRRPAVGKRRSMSLKARVIPCLDVKDGRVVKGVKFVDLRDAGDPVESALAYDRAGADELCFLDIAASHEDRGILLDVVRRTAEVCFMPLTVGGGVRTIDDIRKLLLAGADKASINSAAVADRRIRRVRRRRNSAASAWSSLSTRSARRRRATRRAGRSSPMAAGGRPASTRSLMPGRLPRSVRGKSC